MNVFWHELKMMRMSAVWWLVGLLGTALLFISLYPSFTQDVEASKKLLESFPPALQVAIGLSTDTFFSFFGFYAYVFTYVTLVAAIYSCYGGLTIFSKEEFNKTTDFLFAKPISRSALFGSKLASVLVTVVTVGVLLQVGTYAMAAAFGTGSIDTTLFLLFSGSILLLQLWFMACGMLLSIIMPRIKNVVTTAIAVPFGFLVIGMIGAVIGDDALRYITPFKYVDYQYVIRHHSYEPQYIILSVIIVIMCLIVSFCIYARRDTRAVA